MYDERNEHLKAIVVVGGLASALVLTLLALPALYMIIEGRTEDILEEDVP